MIDYKRWLEHAEKHAMIINMHILSQFLLAEDVGQLLSQSAFYLYDVSDQLWIPIRIGAALSEYDEGGTASTDSITEKLTENFSSPEEYELFRFFMSLDNLETAFRNRRYFQSAHYHLKVNNQLRRLKVSMYLVRDSQSHHLLAYTMVNDTDALYNRIEAIREKAQRDPLTHLFNRLMYQEVLLRYLSSMRSDEQGALIGIDADNFKSINDTYGHKAGDRALLALTRRLQEVFYRREREVIFRMGGDEFTVLVKDTDWEYILARLKSLLERNVSFQDSGTAISFSISAGCAVFKGDASEKQIYETADQALYEAKRSGKNQFRITEQRVLQEE